MADVSVEDLLQALQSAQEQKSSVRAPKLSYYCVLCGTEEKRTAQASILLLLVLDITHALIDGRAPRTVALAANIVLGGACWSLCVAGATTLPAAFWTDGGSKQASARPTSCVAERP